MKTPLSKILNLYIFTNIHVALSVVSLYLIFNKEIDFNYLIFLFASTIFSYGFIRIINIESNRKIYKSYYYDYKILFWAILIISFISTFYTYLKLDLFIQITLIPLGLITIFYQTKFQFFSFRQNGILKVLSVGFVWASLVVLLPEIYHFNDYETILLKFIFVFIYILMLTISFDQRDVLVDQFELRTLPQRYSHLKKLIYFIFFLILFTFIILIYNNVYEFVTAIFILLLSIVLCYNSTEKRGFYYTAFWIEALPIFWLIINVFTTIIT